MVLGGVTIYFSNTLHPPRSQTRLSNGRESHLPSRGGWGIEIIFHYPTPNEKPNEMLVHHLDSAAPSCMREHQCPVEQGWPPERDAGHPDGYATAAGYHGQEAGMGGDL